MTNSTSQNNTQADTQVKTENTFEPIMENLRLDKGLHIPRKFTKEGKDPLDAVEYEIRTSVIKNSDGTVVKEIKNVEVPTFWSQVATDILAQKYFRKAGVPQKNPDGSIKIDEKGEVVLGSETSIKQVVRRMAGCWRAWGEKYGYFADSESAQVFQDEMEHMLIYQMAAPNSPQWFNTGLFSAYGIAGAPQGHFYADPKTGEVKLSENAYERPQPHACFIQTVDDELVNPGGIFDAITREARLFKYGSGTGSNFSKLRARGEKLSGGGTSSGMMSWLRIFDRAAGAIKSGGTTRRAAKMVVVDIDHPDVAEFIDWKMTEEHKVADLIVGSEINRKYLNEIMQVATEEKSIDYKNNKSLKKAVKKALERQIPLNYILRSLALVEQGHSQMDIAVFSTHFEDEAYNTVSGQNSNNSVRLPNAFMKAVEEDSDWHLTWRTTGEVAKTVKARWLWDKIGFAAWNSADPGTQYHTTINEWHTCPKDGEIHASNPCSEYMFLDNTACNLASLNLMKFYDPGTGEFTIDNFKHAVRLWTITLEISVLMAQFPSKEIAELSYKYRTLGLGFANLGSLLMTMGIPYDSKEALSIAGCISSLMSGVSYKTSAEMAQALGAFERFSANKADMLRVIRNHQRASLNSPTSAYEGLSVFPVGIQEEHAPKKLLEEARGIWGEVLAMGERYGFRNAQVTVIAPTGTIGLVMDCATTGVEPDFALVKFKKLAGGGYMKIVNDSLPLALNRLGYSKDQIIEIENYCKGHGTLQGSPAVNPQTLTARGLDLQDIKNIEAALPFAFDIRFVFNPATIGKETLKRLGLETKAQEPNFDLLSALGFSQEEINKTNEYVCGTMTIEGAPHLKTEHYPIFDCATKCGNQGQRYIAYNAHVDMMACVQPFISGAISKTINMPKEASIEEVKGVYLDSWKKGIKAVALYRDGSKLSQPLNTEAFDAKLLLSEEEDEDPTVSAESLHKEMWLKRGVKEPLPSKRSGFTQEATIGGHKIYVRTGEYPDGRLGEVFLDTAKDGAAFRSLLNCFAISISKGLQRGVPLQEYVDTFTFTRFEPSGTVQGHDNIKMATSMLDYVFRLLGFEYLHRDDLVQVKPNSGQTSLPGLETIGNEEKSNEDDSATSPVVINGNGGPQSAQIAKAQGFTGESCSACGSMKMKRNGSCLVCIDCGTTTGCS